MMAASPADSPVTTVASAAASGFQPPTPGGLPATGLWGRLRPLLPRLTRTDERLLPWLVLLLGLLFTILVANYTRREGQRAHLRIERALMDDVADAVQTKLQQDIETISGVAGLFNASPAVSRQAFRRFVESLSVEDHALAGIQGIGFSRFLTAQQRPAVEAEVRAEGFEGFRIRPEGQRDRLSTILYLEPFNRRNQRAFGFDMTSEPVRREAMDRAALTGTPAMSGKVKLLQETSSGIQAGVLIYMPIYRQSVRTLPASAADYPEKLRGWAYSPLRVGDLVQAALRQVNNPDLQGSAVLVYDGAQPTGAALMFDNQKLHGTPQLSDPQFQPITAAGHQWLIGIQLSRGQIGPNGVTAGLWILALSGVISSAAAALVTQLLVASHSRTRSALHAAEAAGNDLRLAAVVFDSSPQAIVVTDPDGHVISANPGFSRVTGYSGTEILGRSLSMLKSGRHEPSFYTDLWDSVRKRGVWQGEIWNRVRSGEVRRQELSITAVLNQQLQTIHYVGMLQDVSDRHQRQESIRHRSLHDPLTGLANRALLLENIEQALAAAEREGQSVGLILMDLDGFKPINDSHGHAMGDRVLQAVAQLVGARLRGSDTLARLGGDEFVVLLPRLSGSQEAVMMLCRRLREAVAAVQEEIEVPITLSASLGIAWSPEHGVTAGQLMAAADAAMYRAKKNPDQPVQWADQAV